MEAIKKFYEDYICLNLKDYPSIALDVEINKLLFFLAIGLCVACFILNYFQSNVSLFLRKLLRAEAFSEENAKTLKDLGLNDNRVLAGLIKKDSGIIKKAVSVIGMKRLTYEEYRAAELERKRTKKEKSGEKTPKDISTVEIDLNEAKFYISDDKRSYAEHAYKNNNGSVIKTLLYSVLILAFYLLIVFLMPSLLTAVNSILT